MNHLAEKFRCIPVLKILIPFVSGILIQLSFPLSKSHIELLLVVSLLLLVIATFYYKLENCKYTITWGICQFFVILFIGLLAAFLKNEKVAIDPNILNSQAYVAQIDEIPTEKPKGISVKVLVETVKVDNKWMACKRFCLLTIGDPSFKKLSPGMKVIIKGKLNLPSKPSFPLQFDYGRYLYNNGVSLVSYINGSEIQILENNPVSIFHKLLKVRKHLLQIISQNAFEKREQAVLSSLLLGFTGDLDPELKNAYAVAGVMHILSVSGLHVGIVYIFLMTFFFFLKDNKKLLIIKYIIVVTGIWFYALIAGFSPPVIRSATMFTFIAIGKLANRQGNPINNLCTSAMLLLLINPFQINDIGFQLSYAAMAGIFVLYEPILNIFTSRFWLVNKIWELVAMSLAAQIATLPLTLLNFHVFPTYFLLANLIIVPLSAIVLYFGIALLLLSFWKTLSVYIALLLKYILVLLNWLVVTIDKFPKSSITNIYTDHVLAILLFISALLFAYMLIYKEYKPVVVLLLIIWLACIDNVKVKIESFNNKQLIISKLGYKPLVTVVNNSQMVHISMAEKIDQISKNTFNFKVRFNIDEEKIINVSRLMIGSDTSCNKIYIQRISAESYFVGFGKTNILVGNKGVCELIPNNNLIVVIDSNELLKNIKPVLTYASQIVALNDRNSIIKDLLGINRTKLKNAYFIDQQGAFIIDL